MLTIADESSINENDAPKNAGVSVETPKTANAQYGTGGTRMTTFGEILRMSKSGGTLAGDSAAYIDAIQATFDRNHSGITNRQLAVEDKVIVAFYNKSRKFAVSLTLVDLAMESQREEPASDLAFQIGKILEAEGTLLVNNIVVCPHDYVHAPKMAREIKLSIENPGAAAFDQLRKSGMSGQFKVTMNLSDVHKLQRAWYPLESLPRTDIGLIVWVKAKKELPTIGGQDWEWEPVLQVGGYTQFIDRQSAHGYMFNGGMNAPKITPRVTITSVQTSIGSPVMYGLALLFAAEYFVKRNGWLMPYEKFGKDMPNLGALVPDAKGKPCLISSQPQLQEFLNNPNVLAPPTLAVDITEGRPGLGPQMSLISNRSEFGLGGDILKSVAKFMAHDGEEINQAILSARPLVGQRDVEYIGYVNGDQDSRMVDYLDLVAKGASDIPSIVRFLFIPQEPQLRGQWISELTDYISLFRNNTVLINPQVIAQMTTAGLNIEIEDDMQSPHNNIGHYADVFYADFSGMSTIGTHHGQPSYAGPNFTPYSF